MKGKTAILLGVGASIGFVSGNVFLATKVIKSERMRKALADIISDKVIKLLYGDSQSIRKYSKVSYHNHYYKTESPKKPSVCVPEEVLFDSKLDADKALDALNEIMTKYGYVSVSDYYDVCGLGTKAVYSDNKYGWSKLDAAYVVRCRDGYTIKLGKAILLK